MTNNKDKIQSAKNCYNEFVKLRYCIIEACCNDLFTVEDVIEKTGYTCDAVIRNILNKLEVEDDACGINYGIVSECIEDDDLFEYMLDTINLEEING